MMYHLKLGTPRSLPSQPSALFSRRAWIAPSLLALTVALAPTGACGQPREVLEALGDCINQYDNQRSIHGCTKVIEASEDQGLIAETYATRGLAHARNKFFDSAIADYSKSIQMESHLSDPAHIKRVYHNRATAYRAKGKLAEAIVDLSKALAIDQNYEKALFARGVLYVEHAWDETEIDLAIQDLQKAIGINPYVAEYYAWLGAAYAAREDDERATENWNKALEIDPGNQPAKGLLEMQGN